LNTGIERIKTDLDGNKRDDVLKFIEIIQEKERPEHFNYY
jgi:hypothetical protein